VVKTPLDCDGSQAAGHRLTRQGVPRLTYRNPLEAQHAPRLLLTSDVWRDIALLSCQKERIYRAHQKAWWSIEWSSLRAKVLFLCLLRRTPRAWAKFTPIACEEFYRENSALVLLQSLLCFPNKLIEPHPEYLYFLEASGLPNYNPPFLPLRSPPSCPSPAGYSIYRQWLLLAPNLCISDGLEEFKSKPQPVKLSVDGFRLICGLDLR